MKIEIAIEALHRIKSPISFMQKELKEGEQLNGQYAIQLASDAKYLQSIAEKTLTEIESIPPQSSTSDEEKDLTTAYIPCDEYDERMIGGFTSISGQSLFYVREIKLETTYKIPKR